MKVKIYNSENPDCFRIVEATDYMNSIRPGSCSGLCCVNCGMKEEPCPILTDSASTSHIKFHYEDEHYEDEHKGMNINETVKEVFEIAKSKGWHEKQNPIPEMLMLMVCEISEAMEEYRDASKPYLYFVDGKPEGIQIELADTVIRIMDMFGVMKWDLESAIRTKIEFNKNRSYKHGGKLC